MADRSDLEQVGRNVRQGITQLVFLIYGVIVVFPMVWLGYTAFKSTSELFASAWALPVEWKLDNFVEAWNEAQIGDFFWNSIFVTISTLLLQLFLGAMASYSLAKYRFPGQNLLYYGFLAGLMFPIFLGPGAPLLPGQAPGPARETLRLQAASEQLPQEGEAHQGSQ